MIWRPHRLPQPVRLAAYGLATAVLLYLCLAPAKDLPPAHLWDKFEHAAAWFVLAGTGLVLWPARPVRIAGFALALGAAVEVLQATLPFGRDGDWRDWVADLVGVSLALLLRAAARAIARRRIRPPRRSPGRA